MASIKQLPKSVHSSLRSAVVLFDLTRVVEELVFNSIDAGAAKINIAISIETCYVKVEDNGCGVTRDSLVLLGERYATSKLQHVAEMDAATNNFGFRGESLGSLSDISLLEITTKAQGTPNGYRKIIKGCKCLYLGIADTRQDFGTTVIVRDLFHNQPVRRKHMHSSPKKILHSVKKCVFRVSLMHPQVSFKVTDIESGSEVLCTHPSPSPLPLVITAFGIDVSHSLCELNYSKGTLKLSGFASGPVDTFPVKALQYIYINSRFVCKGPIHKLLNNIAANSKYLDMWNCTSGSSNGKRRIHTYPAYILNLRCPRSSYDLAFEPSKTVVEFKDWKPVLSFVEQAIRQLWKDTPLQGDFYGQEDNIVEKTEIWKESSDLVFVSPTQDVSRDSLTGRRKRRFEHNQSLELLTLPPFSPKTAFEGSDFSLHMKKHKRSSPELHENTNEAREPLTKSGYGHHADCTLQDVSPTSRDVHDFRSVVAASARRHIHFWPPDNELLPVEDDFFRRELTPRLTFDDDANAERSDSRSGEIFLDVNDKKSTGYFSYGSEVLFSPDSTKDLKKPLMRCCSLLGSTSCVSTFLANRQDFEVETDDCRSRIEELDSDDKINSVVADVSDQNLTFSQHRKSYFVDNFSISNPSPSFQKKGVMMADLDILASDVILPHQGEGDFLNSPLKQYGERVSGFLPTCFERSPASPYPLSSTVAWEGEHLTHEYAPENNFLHQRSARSCNFRYKEGKDEFLEYAAMHIEKDYSASTRRNPELDFYYDFSPEKSVFCPFHGSKKNNSLIHVVGSSNKLTRGTDWLCLDSPATDNMHISSLCYDKDGNSRNEQDSRNCGPYHFHKGRSQRSHSAPPFYKGKSKFCTIYNYVTAAANGEYKSPKIPETPTSDIKHSSECFGVSEPHFEPSPVKESFFHYRTLMQKTPSSRESISAVQRSKDLKKPQSHQVYSHDLVEDLSSNELEGFKLPAMKWRNGNPQIGDRDKSQNLHEQKDILDISSGLLHLAGGSLVPESISKDCLEDTKVLLQLDKKFIPVVAGVTLAVIDQHAADERIRLEELRQKVLLGEGKTVAYLDSEQELILPEVAYQLLQNYSVQIRNWGWICNFHSHGSGSFRKNLNLLHRRTTAVTLLAVPCILGVNLSENDLLEFLEQLSETDGSSTLPPSVVRVLNFKACRGAIMFGDALLPSECSLIVEELKRTSLCFQCAHGRPTTIPLVNLPALHRQISNFELHNGESAEPWHGLQRHTPSVERARSRLISAGGQCG